MLACIGMAPFKVDAERTTLQFNGIPVWQDGAPTPPGARDVDLSGADIAVTIDLAAGAAQASVRTTDLSHGYVEENSAYSS